MKLRHRPRRPPLLRKRTFSQQELQAFLSNYQMVCRTPRLAHALIVLLLTSQRLHDLALARKRDFDLDARTWTIPDEPVKGSPGEPLGHVVPLAAWTIQEIRALMDLSGDSPFLLPRQHDSAPIDPASITRAVRELQGPLRSLGIQPWTPYDLRRTGQEGLLALGVDETIVARVLNHEPEYIQRTPAFLNEKRTALQKWAEHLSELRDQRAAECFRKANPPDHTEASPPSGAPGERAQASASAS